MDKSSTRLLLITLLVIAGILSYVDRGNLAVAEPEISAAFKLDPLQMGWLMSAFFWSYSLFQIGAGWLTDRYDVKWVFAWGYFVWTIATLATGFVNGFIMLFVMRLLLGIGESVVYPAVSRLLLEHFPENRRGLPNALIAAGTKIGPALSMSVGGMIIAVWGWRELFIITGIVSLLWLVPWILYIPSTHVKTVNEKNQRISQPSVPFSELFTKREFWGSTMGFFALGFSVYFLINWLPSYLEKGRNFTKEEMSLAGSLPFWVMGAATVVGGFGSDWVITRGVSPTWGRLPLLVGGFALCAVFMLLVPSTTNDSACLVWLGMGCVGLGLFSSNSWAVSQTLAGPYAAGKWSGVQNAIGNIGGVASSLFTGWALKTTGSYTIPFVTTSIILTIGALSYLLLVRRVRPLTWKIDSLLAEQQNAGQPGAGPQSA